jgi:hypothetical protein
MANGGLEVVDSLQAMAESGQGQLGGNSRARRIRPLPPVGREIKKGKKEVPGLDKVLLIEGRNSPLWRAFPAKSAAPHLSGYAGNARERAYSGLLCKEIVYRHILTSLAMRLPLLLGENFLPHATAQREKFVKSCSGFN